MTTQKWVFTCWPWEANHPHSQVKQPLPAVSSFFFYSPQSEHSASEGQESNLRHGVSVNQSDIKNQTWIMVKTTLKTLKRLKQKSANFLIDSATNQRLAYYCINKSEIRIRYCQPIRSRYSPASNGEACSTGAILHSQLSLTNQRWASLCVNQSQSLSHLTKQNWLHGGDWCCWTGVTTLVFVARWGKVGLMNRDEGTVDGEADTTEVEVVKEDWKMIVKTAGRIEVQL